MTQPIDQPLDVLVIGSGFSGVCVGIKLLEHCVDKYGLRPYIVHGAHVVEMQLDITTLSPKNAAAFKRQLARVRFDDFEFMEPHRPDKAA
jgi:hypothetical protein